MHTLTQWHNNDVKLITFFYQLDSCGPFLDYCKIQIMWKAGCDLFKDELTQGGISCCEGIRGVFETCKDKLLQK